MRATNESFDSCNYVNGWFPTVYRVAWVKTFVCFSLNLPIQNFQIVLLVYPELLSQHCTAITHKPLTTTQYSQSLTNSSVNSQKEGITATHRLLPRKPRISSTDRQQTLDSGYSSNHSALTHSLSQYHHSPLTSHHQTAHSALAPDPRTSATATRPSHAQTRRAESQGRRQGQASLRRLSAVPSADWRRPSPCRDGGRRLGYTASGGVCRQQPSAVEDGSWWMAWWMDGRGWDRGDTLYFLRLQLTLHIKFCIPSNDFARSIFLPKS